MKKEELIKIFSAYLPYSLDLLYKDFPNEKPVRKAKLSGVTTTEIETRYKRKIKGCVGDIISWSGNNNVFDLEVKPVLYDLSYLTKEIEYEGKRFIPIEYFEITDDSDSYPIEHDHGNIKLIKDLESIAKNNSYHDIQFLPFEVVQRLISWKINVFGLKENEFINKATLNKG